MLARAGALRRHIAASLRCLASAEASLAAGLPGPAAAAAHDPPAVQSPLPVQGLGRWASSLEQTAAAATSSNDPFHPRQATYYVEVITGDVRGAGSPAPAAITLFGEDGESESHVIGAEESGAGFQRATRKTYVIYAKDLGSLKRILVQQLAPTELPDRPVADNDDQAATTGWYLDRIEVRGPEGEHWVFPCGAWLGTSAAGAPGTPQRSATSSRQTLAEMSTALLCTTPHTGLHSRYLSRPLELRCPTLKKCKQGPRASTAREQVTAARTLIFTPKTAMGSTRWAWQTAYTSGAPVGSMLVRLAGN